jgi:release factor glutamine methyltransferase
MSSYDWKMIASCRNRSKDSQAVAFPYFMEAYEMNFQVNEHVFSPVHCSSYRFFIPWLPDASGMDVLEIGSGHGVVSCYLAQKAKKVLATDINEHAVENTAINARLNGLDNIETIESNVYSNVSGQFDLIFWNTPWGFVPEEFEESMTPEEFGMFDPGYKAISAYLLEGKNYLKPGGALYIGFGHKGANLDLIHDLVKRSGLVLAKGIAGKYTPGELDEDGRLIEMRVELWKLVKPA